MKKICMIVAALCAAFCCALPTFAADRKAPVYETFSPDMVMEIMKEEGYSVSLDDDGDICWKVDGYKTWITFYKENRSIQFYTIFESDAGLDKHNEFNKNYRYARSYMPKSGSARVEMDLSFHGGITKKRLLDSFKDWKAIFSLWREKVL